MAVENIKTEPTNILQQMRLRDSRSNILDSRPAVARPEPSGATNNLVGSPAAPAAPAAPGAGWNQTWSAEAVSYTHLRAHETSAHL
eukprot:10134924-Alexandrium_andersonii.AAC.1